MLDQTEPQSKLLSQRTIQKKKDHIVYSLLSLQLQLCYKDKADEKINSSIHRSLSLPDLFSKDSAATPTLA